MSNYDWKFWRRPGPDRLSAELDGLVLGVVIGFVFCAALTLVLILL